MCTWIIEKATVNGSAKGGGSWFAVNEAAVYYDHPYPAPFDHVLTVDIAADLERPEHRVRLELDRDSAQRLVVAMQSALDSGTEGHRQASA